MNADSCDKYSTTILRSLTVFKDTGERDIRLIIA